MVFLGSSLLNCLILFSETMKSRYCTWIILTWVLLSTVSWIHLLQSFHSSQDLYLPCYDEVTDDSLIWIESAKWYRTTTAVNSTPSKNRAYVITFYDPTMSEDAPSILQFWRQTWTACGWETVVLNDSYARTHRFYHEYNRVIRNLPTVNRWRYEEACYNRWIAYEQWIVENNAYGIVMTSDYDVMNRGFEPKDWKKKPLSQGDDSYCHLHYDQVPSLVSVNYLGVAGLKRLISTQATKCRVIPSSWKRYAPAIHTSDMILLLDHPSVCKFESLSDLDGPPITSNFGEEGWWNTDIVHFSHHHTKAAGYDTQLEAVQRHIERRGNKFTFIS